MSLLSCKNDFRDLWSQMRLNSKDRDFNSNFSKYHSFGYQVCLISLSLQLVRDNIVIDSVRTSIVAMDKSPVA